MRAITFIVFCSLFLSSFGFAKSEEAKGKVVKIGVDDIVELDQQSSISLVDLVDSRCPAEVHCIWPGQVLANFTFFAGSEQENFSLVLHQDISNQVEINDYIFEIKKIAEWDAESMFLQIKKSSARRKP